ncbi:HNH endonuclease signature motif containing protein [Streptomyces roseus]|uniref:HNH endonuclease signature motif containing protein n=1 Tax=Streptomyces roseus TaxID=66430 RepID=UPI003405FECD
MSTVRFGDERLPARFWVKVAAQATGCWQWTGAKNPDGYGGFWHAGAFRLAHRVAFVALLGPIPDGLVVRHDCDNPNCVNPHHLRTGTQSDNGLDCVERGRHPHASKVTCPQGHAYSEANTYVRSNGSRTCRACQRESVRRYRLRNVGAKSPQHSLEADR